MHQNIAIQSWLYPSSDTNDSTKQHQHPFSELPFSLSLTASSPLLTRPTSIMALWTNSEKKNYFTFTCYFREVLNSLNAEKRNWNLFKAMSKFIKTRNPQQCRSYHLKLLKEFNGIRDFLSRGLNRIGRFKEKMHEAEKALAEIQEEFQLYSQGAEEAFAQKVKLLIECPSIHKNERQQQCSLYQQKIEKQEFKKTAASYEQAQHPVSNNNFYGGFSLSVTFPNAKTKASKSSLPSFDYDEELTENCPKPNKLRGETFKASKNYQKDFSCLNQMTEPDQINFDTFAVPNHIRTTEQMYKLWENSCDDFACQKEQRRL